MIKKLCGLLIMVAFALIMLPLARAAPPTEKTFPCVGLQNRSASAALMSETVGLATHRMQQDKSAVPRVTYSVQYAGLERHAPDIVLLS